MGRGERTEISELLLRAFGKSMVTCVCTATFYGFIQDISCVLEILHIMDERNLEESLHEIP